MKHRVYIIAGLALINIVIMKYQDSRKENRISAWAVTQGEKHVTDSLQPLPGQQ